MATFPKNLAEEDPEHDHDIFKVIENLKIIRNGLFANIKFG